MTTRPPHAGKVIPIVPAQRGTEEADRRLAAVVCFDVVGYSRLMEVDEAGTHDALSAFRRESIEPLVESHHGRIVKLTGDGALIEFASAVDAVQCAFRIQEKSAAWNEGRPEDQRIVFRIGVNVGDIIVDDNDIYGTGVIVAARLQSLADPGSVFVSSAVVEQVGKRGGLGFDYVGERVIKNIAEPVNIYRIRADTGPSGDMRNGSVRSGRQRLLLFALTPLLVLCAGLAVWQFGGVRQGAAGVAAGKASIAVMPFRNLSADRAQDYLAEGINEDLITDLAKFPGLYVASRSASIAYKDKSASAQQVRGDLGVSYLLEGGVQKSPDSVRVTVQLIDTASGANLWSERYDRSPEAIFQIQDDITKSIAATLMGTTGMLAEAELKRLARKPAKTWLAYDYLIHGWHEWYKFTPERNLEARRLFEAARNADPDYPRAYVGLAWTYALDYEYDWTDKYDETVQQALTLAKKAVDLDEKDYRGFWVLGWAYLYGWQHEQATAAYDKARQMNPNDAELMAEMTSLLIYTGRPKQAVEQIQEAMRRNPFYDSWFVEYLGWAYQEAGMAKQCVETLEKIIDPDPPKEQLWLLRIVSACYADPSVNRMDRARATAAKILALDPSFSLAAHRKYVEETLPYQSPELIDNWMKAFARVGLPA